MLTLIKLLIILCVLVSSIAFGKGLFDEYGGLIWYENKTKVSCPVQNLDTGVILVLGQSNAANHADKKIIIKYP